MKKEAFLNLEDQIFNGNLLDIGFSNHGVIYKICKQHTDDYYDVDYIEGNHEKKRIVDGSYDSCALFFTLRDIKFAFSKTKLIKEIYGFLKSDGLLYIWDVDKGFAKSFNSIIKIILPDKSIKQIYLKDLNVFKDSSKEKTIKILQPYFEVLTVKNSDGIYSMVCKKKGKTKDESIVSGS